MKNSIYGTVKYGEAKYGVRKKFTFINYKTKTELWR